MKYGDFTQRNVIKPMAGRVSPSRPSPNEVRQHPWEGVLPILSPRCFSCLISFVSGFRKVKVLKLHFLIGLGISRHMQILKLHLRY